uniref:Uncharacterized protein n=1 Tax=Oryza rufipogon TaxID=4529 RepID=A0A0E0PN32_ORYRU
MPTGFVRDEAEGGKSGGVAPLRRPAAHVPCSLAARSASSKKRVENLREGNDTGERWQEVLTPSLRHDSVKRQRICQIAILAMRFSSHHSPLVSPASQQGKSPLAFSATRSPPPRDSICSDFQRWRKRYTRYCG